MDISGVLRLIKSERVISVPINELTPNPLQPRKHFDENELHALADSIKNFGVIQPISVKKIPSGENSKFKYEIIAGERRWRASKIAKLKRVPCIIFEADRADSAAIALVENLQRSDLSYFEEAYAMNTLLHISGCTQCELARALSISQSALSNKLRLLKLSERERLIAIENRFSERHCRALVRIEAETERSEIIRVIIKNKLRAPEAETLIDEYIKRKEAKAEPQAEEPKIQGKLEDMRFLYNTLDKTIKLLHNSGYSASWTKAEENNNLEVKIIISK